MLVELRVRDLGVIESVALDLGPGMTALTGETGAGKTLLVEALELLVGGRPTPAWCAPGPARRSSRVDSPSTTTRSSWPAPFPPRDARGPGSTVAWPRSRRWPRPGPGCSSSTASTPSSRCSTPAPNAGRWTPSPGSTSVRSAAARARRRALHERARSARRRRPRPGPPGRPAALPARPRSTPPASPTPTRTTPSPTRRTDWPRRPRIATRPRLALDALDSGDGGGRAVVDLLGSARAALDGRGPLSVLAGRLASLQADASDVASELRHVVETWDDDPERLEEVRARRQLLRELSRKYGEGPAGVLAFADEARRLLAELDAAEERAAALLERARRRRRRGRPRPRPPSARRGAGRPRSWPAPSRSACGDWPCRTPGSR